MRLQQHEPLAACGLQPSAAQMTGRDHTPGNTVPDRPERSTDGSVRMPRIGRAPDVELNPGNASRAPDRGR